MLFLNMDFKFAYLANFNFAHFNIVLVWVKMGLVWVKLENGEFHLQFSFRVFKTCSIQE